MTTLSDRDDTAAAGALVELLVPDPAIRSTVLSFVARSILAAHEAGPSSWNVSGLGKKRVLLNVSHCFMIAIHRDLFYLCVHSDFLTGEIADLLGERLDPNPIFRSLPPGRQVTLQYDELETWLPRLEHAHLALVAVAGPMFRLAPNRRAHRPGLVTFISEQTGIELPNPEFVDLTDTGSSVTTSWLFQCNPKTYNLRAALRELPAITWVVRQHKSDIAEGHTAFLWEAGRNAGILARGRVAAAPLSGVKLGDDEKFILMPGQFEDTELFVPIDIEHVYRPPVSRAALKRDPQLAGMRILKFTQGTNFPVTDAETEALLDLESAPDARFWSVATEPRHWAECRDGGYVAVAWPEIGDISAMSREQFDRNVDSVAVANPGDYSHTGASQMWTFASIKPGDVVVASGGADLALGIGTVTGPYSYVASSPHAHRLAVRWDDVQARRHAGDARWKRLVVGMTHEEFDGISWAPPIGEVTGAGEDADAVATASDILESIEAEPIMPVEPNEMIPLERVAKETHFDLELLERWVRAIHRKGQAVLYGPPGTGKTYVAEWLARHLASGGFGTIETVQFHPAYSYEEFMAGIRPRTRDDGSLEYALEDGFFVRFCDRARKLDGTSVLVIDELNRANLPRVFGELMYLLEYRDKDVAIAGSRRFSIPDNVRILGTMNTADRSIALVDHALRRRFAFLGLPPNYDVLRERQAGPGIDVEGLIQVLMKLNAAIEDPHYEVGISFFCGPDLAASIADIWQMEIEPYIEEYFFDRRSLFAEYRWAKVKAAILGPGADEP